MDTITAFVKRHPLVAYFVLAYALTWPLILLLTVSPLWGFLPSWVPRSRQSSWPRSRMAGLA